MLTAGRTLFCANAGDSMAVVYSSATNTVTEMSRMHKASDPDEIRRITAAGGRVRHTCLLLAGVRTLVSAKMVQGMRVAFWPVHTAARPSPARAAAGPIPQVTMVNGCPRVNDVLATSRGVGDLYLKALVPSDAVASEEREQRGVGPAPELDDESRDVRASAVGEGPEGRVIV